MQEIRGRAKNIRELLQNARFGIDYFQREYRWGDKQVSEALDDLTNAFRTSREDHGASRDPADHDRYFLGSIVISESAGTRFITDGQQRITTITLLLTAMYRRLQEGAQPRRCRNSSTPTAPERPLSTSMWTTERSA